MKYFLNSILFFVLFCFFFSGCSSELVKPQLPENYTVKQVPQVSTPVDSAEVNEELISEDLKESEYYYALGVEANQKGDWEKAQSYFEKALDILANLNLDEEIHSKNIDKYNRLLKEIASDYKITLLSLGLLEDETSISAFLEKFGDIENFQGLRESLDVKIEYSDTAVTTYDMPIEWNERVENSILYLQTIAREAFIQYLSRSGKYIDIAREILKEKNMPLDLAYLPLIESGYNPRARSWANAVGMWQFIPSTGRIYGLKSNWWYDEKRDFIKSTYAACNYLNKLYNDFGCWKLALAAYNCGEGGLSRAIKKYHTTNFWELNLRKQTYDYVPLYMAATIIAKNPQKYGFDIEYEKPLKYDMVNVDKPVELKTISDILNVSAAEIRDLNPEILRDVTPPQYQDYKLRIPAGTKELFEQKYAELPAKKLFAMHKVRKGETISGIARSYGIPTYSILQANTLSKRAVIYPGQYLKIPGEGQVDRNYSASADAENKNQKTRVSKNTAVRGYEVYKIKSGDNLVYIAGKFNTTVSALEKLNGIDRNQILKVGQRLRIPSDQSYQIYKVRSGDNLSSIAKKFNTTVKAIKQSNNMSRSNRIIAGEKLRIPVKSQGDQQQELLVHKVEIGETLWGIARIFGVPLEKILEWNDLSNPSYVQAGDKIKIFIAR